MSLITWLSNLVYTGHSIKQYYAFIVRHIIPGPLSISYFIPNLLNIIALLIPPERLSRNTIATLFIPIAIGCTIHAWTVIGGPDGASIAILLWLFHTLWLEDVRRDYKLLKVRRKDLSNGAVKDGKDESPEIVCISYPRPILARIEWVLNLVYSPRLTNWETPSASHTARQKRHLASPRPSRTRFVCTLIIEQLAIIAMLMPIVQLRREALVLPTTNLSWVTDVPLGTRRITKYIRSLIPPLILQPLTTGLYLFSGVYMNFQHAVPLVILSNFLLAYPSDEWSLHMQPPIFGPLSAVMDKGLAGLWGGWWHQFVRVAMSTPGKHLGRKLGLKDHTLASYACQVVSAFFFSGVMHACLIPPQPLKASEPVWKLRLLIAAFFWVQPLGFALEMLVGAKLSRYAAIIGTSKRQGPAIAWALKALRLVWVFSWLCVTLPIFELPFRELMCWEIWPFIFYPRRVRYFLAGQWLP